MVSNWYHLLSDYIFLVMLVGDAGVGKTSLLFQYAAFKTLGLDGKSLRVRIWDAAGQTRFLRLVTSHYHSAHGIIVVYNVTNRESFVNAENWIDGINQYASKDVCKLLVGNSCDTEGNKVVSYDEGKELADRLGIKFLETSAKTAHNVSEAFLTIISEIKYRKESASDTRDG